MGFANELQTNITGFFRDGITAINKGVGGYTMQNLKDATVTHISQVVTTALPVKYILLTIGNNDVWDEANAETWKANALFVADAWHTQFPGAPVFFNRPWANGKAGIDLIYAWIAEVIASRDFIYAGPDEVALLVPPDNGVTNYSDGIHPNDAGKHLLAIDWQARMGL